MKHSIKIALISLLVMPIIVTYCQYYTNPSTPVDQIIKIVQVAPITSTNPTNLPTSSVFAPTGLPSAGLRMTDITPVVPRPISIGVPPTVMPLTAPVFAQPVPIMPIAPAAALQRQSIGPARAQQQKITLVQPTPAPAQPANQAK